MWISSDFEQSAVARDTPRTTLALDWPPILLQIRHSINDVSETATYG
jgi:hypothetical protein